MNHAYSHVTDLIQILSDVIEGIVCGISNRDQKFIRQTLQHDISKRKTDILKICEDQGIQSYVVGLDYTNVPVRVTYGALDVFRPNGYVKEAWDNVLDKVRGRDVLVVHGQIAAGAGEKSYTQYVSMESFRKDGRLFMMQTCSSDG